MLLADETAIKAVVDFGDGQIFVEGVTTYPALRLSASRTGRTGAAIPWGWVFGGSRSSIWRAGISPMSDQEESVWVVFNGEIYNFRELNVNWKGTAMFSVRSQIQKLSFMGTSSGAMKS